MLVVSIVDSKTLNTMPLFLHRCRLQQRRSCIVKASKHFLPNAWQRITFNRNGSRKNCYLLNVLCVELMHFSFGHFVKYDRIGCSGTLYATVVTEWIRIRFQQNFSINYICHNIFVSFGGIIRFCEIKSTFHRKNTKWTMASTLFPPQNDDQILCRCVLFCSVLFSLSLSPSVVFLLSFRSVRCFQFHCGLFSSVTVSITFCVQSSALSFVVWFRLLFQHSPAQTLFLSAVALRYETWTFFSVCHDCCCCCCCNKTWIMVWFVVSLQTSLHELYFMKTNFKRNLWCSNFQCLHFSCYSLGIFRWKFVWFGIELMQQEQQQPANHPNRKKKQYQNVKQFENVWFCCWASVLCVFSFDFRCYDSMMVFCYSPVGRLLHFGLHLDSKWRRVWAKLCTHGPEALAYKWVFHGGKCDRSNVSDGEK